MQPAILFYAIPFFVLLLSIEAWYSYKENKHLYNTKDTFGSLGLGIGNVITGLFTKALIFGIFSFLYQHRLFTIVENHWWYWVLLFFADDLSYYCFHRTSHFVNYFWASHVVHHSSQYYNLAAALRQTWTGNATGAFLFWAWMPLVGFNPLWILFMQQLSLIYQFWIHTETIQKLPPVIEYIFNTPSHHRVHHGSNLKYLDKNHGGILILWDRIFNSFKAEDERPVYGLTNNINSNNPAMIALTTWASLLKKVTTSGSFKNGIFYLIKSPGWSHDGSTKTTKQLKYNQHK